MKTPCPSLTTHEDEEWSLVDCTKYRRHDRCLFILSTNRPNIMFQFAVCARFQEAPKTSHLKAVKRILRYIKGTTHLGLWYPKGTSIETVVYADSDHAGDYVERKRTSGEMTLEDELRYTKSYVPTISNENYIPDILKPVIRNLECRSIHEGRHVFLNPT
ncbi:hypothetical protein Tco_0434727 [Tanacetum coccineum]